MVQNPDKLGNIEWNKIRCFAVMPIRCTSLNLAVRYADVINSVLFYCASGNLKNSNN